MDISRDLGRRVRDLRTAHGWSQGELGHHTGLHQTSISKIELGQRATTVDELVALADAFEVSVGFLLGRDEEPTQSEVPWVTAEMLSHIEALRATVEHLRRRQ